MFVLAVSCRVTGAAWAGAGAGGGGGRGVCVAPEGAKRRYRTRHIVILMPDQSDAGNAGIFSRRTNGASDLPGYAAAVQLVAEEEQASASISATVKKNNEKLKVQIT
eukprot:7933985-Pyramimonas_sp.AAC.1